MIAIVSIGNFTPPIIHWYTSRMDLYDAAVDTAIANKAEEPAAGRNYERIGDFAAVLAEPNYWLKWWVVESAAHLAEVEAYAGRIATPADRLALLLPALRAEFVHNLQADPLQARYDVAPALSLDAPGVYRDQNGGLRFYSFLD